MPFAPEESAADHVSNTVMLGAQATMPATRPWGCQPTLAFRQLTTVFCRGTHGQRIDGVASLCPSWMPDDAPLMQREIAPPNKSRIREAAGLNQASATLACN